MIYQSNRIISDLQGASIATAAGVSSMVGRVSLKVGEVDQFAQVNMGRLPCIYIRQVSVDYEFQAEPNQFGTRESDWVISILVPTFINRSNTQYQLLEDIKQASLAVLTQDVTLGVTNIREEIPIVSQMATRMDIRFTTQTSYENTYTEG